MKRSVGPGISFFIYIQQQSGIPVQIRISKVISNVGAAGGGLDLSLNLELFKSKCTTFMSGPAILIGLTCNGCET